MKEMKQTQAVSKNKLCYLMRKWQMLMVALLLAVPLLSLDYLKSEQQSARYLTFSFYKLAQQWPPSVCNGGPGCNIMNFTIHGLWPQQPCNHKHHKGYTNIEDEPLLQRLNQSWPSVIRRSNRDFWKHEWNRHGACSGLTQNEYFKTGLDLKDKFDIHNELTHNEITPGGLYDKKRIADVIQFYTKARPVLRCRAIAGDPEQLFEVHICFNVNLAVVDCSGKCNCTGTISFPR